MRNTSASVLVLAAVSLAGCERRESTEPALTPASRTASGIERATDELTSARCDRELRCENIGADESYTSREDCMRSLWSETYDDVDACEDGIDPSELRECLAEIAEDDCDDVLGGIDRYVACKLDDLCAR